MPSAQGMAGQPECSKGAIHPKQGVPERMRVFGQDRLVEELDACVTLIVEDGWKVVYARCLLLKFRKSSGRFATCADPMKLDTFGAHFSEHQEVVHAHAAIVPRTRSE